jgi:hypothetical protein
MTIARDESIRQFFDLHDRPYSYRLRSSAGVAMSTNLRTKKDGASLRPQVLFTGKDGQLKPAVHTELTVYVAEMPFNRLLADG